MLCRDFLILDRIIDPIGFFRENEKKIFPCKDLPPALIIVVATVGLPPLAYILECTSWVGSSIKPKMIKCDYSNIH